MVHSIELKVIPSSGRSVIIIDKDGAIKCYLKNAPERGAANKELIQLIAKRLGIAQNLITIITGATSRKKVLKIETDISKKELHDLLGITKQLQLF